jgi:arylsulfatase A-like enzyme
MYNYFIKPQNPIEQNLWFNCPTYEYALFQFNTDPIINNGKTEYSIVESNPDEFINDKYLKYVNNSEVFIESKVFISTVNENTPIILITFDQLRNLDNLPKELLDELPNLKKAREEMMYFTNHYSGGQPCSTARGEIYTGQPNIKSGVTDNSESSWQYDLNDKNNGLDTIGSILKKSSKTNYYNRYIGKWHLSSKTLNKSSFTNTFPSTATDNFMEKYGFDKFNNQGDNSYDKRGGIYSDSECNNVYLPKGFNNADNENTEEPSDGAISFLKYKAKNIQNYKNKKGQNYDSWFMCVNYTNPHDIAYLFSDKSNLANAFAADNTPSGKTYSNVGLSFNSPDYIKSLNITNSTDFNNNFFELLQKDNKFKKIPLSATENNPIYSVDNTSGHSTCDLNSLFAQSTCLYGIDVRDGETYNSFLEQYRNAYFNLCKQVDNEFGKLWDLIIKEKLNEKAVIIITADHGDYIGEHGLIGKGLSLYKGCWNVPLFISYPNMNNALKGNTFKDKSCHKQILPTLLYLSNNKDLEEYYSKQMYDIKLSNLSPSIINNKLIPIDYLPIQLGCSGLYTIFGPSTYVLSNNNILLNLLNSPVWSIGIVSDQKYNSEVNQYTFGIEFSLFDIIKSSYNILPKIIWDKTLLDNYDIYKINFLQDFYIAIDIQNSKYINSDNIKKINKNDFMNNESIITQSGIINKLLNKSDLKPFLFIPTKYIDSIFSLKKNSKNLNIQEVNSLSLLLNGIFSSNYLGLQKIQQNINNPRNFAPKIIGHFKNFIFDYNDFESLTSGDYNFKLFNNDTDIEQNINLLDPKRIDNYKDLANDIFTTLKNECIKQEFIDMYITGPYFTIADFINKTSLNENTSTSSNNFFGMYQTISQELNINFNFNPEGGLDTMYAILARNYINLRDKLQ